MALTLAHPLHTDRLEIRTVARTDLEALMAVNGDPEVTRYLPYRTWTAPSDAEAWLARMQGIVASGDALQMVVVLRASACAIGTVLLFHHLPEHGRAELGYVLGRSYWGQGLMREALGAVIDHAFGPLQLRRLEADVNPRNLASSGILQRLGFLCEGRLRERWLHHGEPQDASLHGLLARDWQARAR